MLILISQDVILSEAKDLADRLFEILQSLRSFRITHEHINIMITVY